MSKNNQNPSIFCLLLSWRSIPSIWLRWRIWGSVIGGWLPRRPAIIVTAYSCHGHRVVGVTLSPFRHNYLDKLLHISSSMLHWNFSTKRHLCWSIAQRLQKSAIYKDWWTLNIGWATLVNRFEYFHCRSNKTICIY